MFFYTVGPNTAMVVSGCCHNEPLYVVGGSKWVWPFIQQVQKLTLNVITLEIYSPRVYTAKGVQISVTGVAQVKVQGQNEEMLKAACQQLLGKSESQIRNLALETVEGHQRAIMGMLTVEEIYRDRSKFSEKVFEVASSDLVNMGISVISYTLKSVSDEHGYLHSLGATRESEVKRDARMGEAAASRDARIREATAREAEQKSKYENDIQIAKAKRDYEIQKAIFDEEVNTNKARADMAYKLQAAKTQQAIKEEEMNVKIIERTQAIALQQQEIQRRERQLEATVKRPAEAEKFKLEKTAAATRTRLELEAQAEAEAIKLKGEADAYAIQVKGEAEAEQMAKKAAAWAEYRDAAVVDMLLKTLPQVAAEVAAPLTASRADIKMISTGDGEVGAARLTGEVMNIMDRLPSLVNNLTGVDISKQTSVLKAK